MSFIKKIVSMLKTQDDGLYANQAPFDEDENPINQRQFKREYVDNEFCIFLAPHCDELDTEKAPFLLAHLVNISNKGAAFACVSNIACTPYNPDLEEEIKVSSEILLLPNLKISLQSCGASSCNSNGQTSMAEPEQAEPIKAIVLWVKPNQFGCAFKDDNDKIIKMINNIKKDNENK